MSIVFFKRPAERLDYDLDFAKRKWLTAGDSIASIVATLTTEAGGTLALDGTSFTSSTVKVWVKLGTDGETGEVTVEITTAQGREKEVCFKVRVRENC